MKSFVRFKIFSALFILSIAILFYAYSKESIRPINASNQEIIFPTILIDAGHGGFDGGAVAADGTEEQHINLQIAKELEKQLQVLGFNTIMTRYDSNSIHDASKTGIRHQKVSDIHNRMKLLNDTPNCILVSIHQNKFNNKKLWGTQVFYSPNTTLSPLIADAIQQSVVLNLQPNNLRKIKKSTSSIYLLYRAKKPAVLVECGFLSNPEELNKLKEKNYQRQMAFSIALGLLNFYSTK